MLIETTRFGKVDIDQERIIELQDGLLGFPRSRRFALIQTTQDPAFLWLQSLDDAALAFLVCDPAPFVPGYEAHLRPDDAALLGLESAEDGQAFVIVNKVDGHLTANLLGPLVVNTRTLRGKQVVLSERRYSTRHRLLKLAAERAARTA